MSNDLGIDRSGNGNNWTVNNMAFADQVVDSPTNNFATLNPLDSNSNITLAEGNLKAVYTSSTWYSSRGTFSPTSGKWYFEAVMPSYWAYLHIGVLRNSYNVATNNTFTDAGSWTYQSDGRTYNEDNEVTTNVPAAGTGDVMQVAYDVDAGKIWFGINNTWILSGNPTTAANPVFTGITSEGDISPHILVYGSPATGVVTNFGQDSSFAGNKTAQGNQDGNNIGDFYYTPPTGFLALCTSNLPDVDVVPSEHFNTVLYTGTDDTGSGHSITGVGFEPSLVWTKDRDAAYGHYLFDAVRGTGVTKGLRSNTTADEGMANESYDALSSFDSDGFTITGTAFGSLYQDRSSADYVAWNWKANGSGSSNTDGTINTTATSANVDSGFSISTYSGNNTSGATVGHGLSKAPELILIKKRSAAAAWGVYNKTDGNTKVSNLDLNAPSYASSGIWNNTTPSASVFTLGNNALVNGPSTTYVAYCFHSVDGYSKIGSYEGNDDADGTFVYTGFRPAYVMIKSTNAYQNWQIFDNKRDSYNEAGRNLRADITNVEGGASGLPIDFLSNGFKLRIAGDWTNDDTLIYLAFAETPFKYSNAR